MPKHFVSADGSDTVKDPTPVEGATLRRRGYTVYDSPQSATAAAKRRRDAAKSKPKAAEPEQVDAPGDVSADQV